MHSQAASWSGHSAYDLGNPGKGIAPISTEFAPNWRRPIGRQLKVFYNFHFTDELHKSGIAFHHHALPYATDHYIANHYDHGTGIAAADADGDGLYDIYFVNQVDGYQLRSDSGHEDLYVITVNQGNKLFQNDGHHFKKERRT